MRDRHSKPKKKEIIKDLYRIENEKIKEIKKNLLRLESVFLNWRYDDMNTEEYEM